MARVNTVSSTRALAIAALVSLVASCGSDGGDAVRSGSTDGPLVTRAPVTTPGPATTTGGTSITAMATSTVPASTPSDTLAPTTNVGSTSTPAASTSIIDPLLLAQIDIGASDVPHSVFGIEPISERIDVDPTIASVDAVLGAPTGDSGWLPLPTHLACTGDDEHRSVVWNDLRLSFQRGATGAHLAAWTLGAPPVDVIAPPAPVAPAGRSNVTTTDGVGVGSPRAELDRYGVYSEDAGRVFIRTGAMAVSASVTDGRIVSIGSGPLESCPDPDEER